MNNIIGGMKSYNVYCSKCDWNENVTVHKDFDIGSGFITKLLGFKTPIPSKCPECNSKTKKWENKHIQF